MALEAATLQKCVIFNGTKHTKKLSFYECVNQKNIRQSDSFL